jgi:hypothetical protein
MLFICYLYDRHIEREDRVISIPVAPELDRGHGSAISLARLIVGTRGTRHVLALGNNSDATGFDITAGTSVYIRSEDLIEVDHIIPRSQGPKDNYNNIQSFYSEFACKVRSFQSIGWCSYSQRKVSRRKYDRHSANFHRTRKTSTPIVSRSVDNFKCGPLQQCDSQQSGINRN